MLGHNHEVLQKANTVVQFLGLTMALCMAGFLGSYYIKAMVDFLWSYNNNIMTGEILLRQHRLTLA